MNQLQVFSNERLGKIRTMNIDGQATWTNRMKEPWKQFGLDDFRLLSKYCRVDFVELVNGRLRLKGE